MNSAWLHTLIVHTISAVMSIRSTLGMFLLLVSHLVHLVSFAILGLQIPPILFIIQIPSIRGSPNLAVNRH